MRRILALDLPPEKCGNEVGIEAAGVIADGLPQIEPAIIFAVARRPFALIRGSLISRFASGKRLFAFEKRIALEFSVDVGGVLGGVAVAAQPKGPFVDPNPEPLVCQTDQGGSIDASPFRDADGKLYLYYKSDGNAVGKRTFIWGQRLSDDGQSLSGDPVALVQDDAKWEWRLVEAPSMVKSPGGYQLFFSAAFFGWDYPKERLSNYATGYANCSGPLGPCTDAPENPLLHSFNDRDAGCLSGPGHPAIFQVGQRHFIAFHAWAATSGCRPAEGERFLYIAPLFGKDGKPQIGMSLRESK